ncbi:UDP-3-O-(3-hydroxymyristoyl)glucosamine N-acyltransferase [Phycisphaerales bacterium AB-hyl4]|uniref:UDP-3-O-acylglucosamine N-acyltransferase n=1 Tax=Natronomicrosphaera hydrolytica TaxID=3242702 RepID=A0ABV4TZF4_9BACT
MKRISLQDIAQQIDGEVVGDATLEIDGVADLASARSGQLSFVGSDKYIPQWPDSQASAAIVPGELELAIEPGDGRALVRVANVDLAMARVLELFAPAWPEPGKGVHPSAVVDPSAELGDDVQVGPGCIIGPRVRVGAGSILQASVNLMADVSIGENCVLWPGVVVRERCTLGDRCILHPNVSIGADGFGYRPSADGGHVVKVPQIGTVEIGHDVEIGANSCVDRGKFAATVIGDHSKLDNLVQIGHNCKIGRCVIMAGCAAVAGSVIIGDGTVLGGMVAIKDHITIGKGVRLTGCAQVMNDIPDGETWGGGPALPIRDAIRVVQAMRRLPDLVKKFKSR